jgi:hypothetical protein
MKILLKVVPIVAAVLLSACVNTGGETTSQAAGLCQVSNAVLGQIDQSLPTLQLWKAVLSDIASSSDFAIPSLPGISEETGSYYQMGLMALDTALNVNGCPSGALKGILAKEL